MKIKILGAHNCETREYGHTCFVVDDILAVDAGSLTSNLSMEEQKHLKAVILSHRHYDHIRDVTALSTNLYHSGMSTDVYASSDVVDTLDRHFFTSGIYTDLTGEPQGKPTLRMNILESYQTCTIVGYEITPVPVNHSGITNGFKIVSSDGKQVFYTSDTGPELDDCWKQVSPQLLLIEVTQSNKFEFPGHLTPDLLRQELILFKDIKGDLPEVIAVHMNPLLEDMIKVELAAVADELNCRISPGYEGMEIVL